MLNKRNLAATFLEGLAHRGKHPQPGAADEFQAGQIKHQVFHPASEHRGQLLFKLGSGGGVQASDQFDGDRSGILAGNTLLDLDFKWHIGFAFF